jgi:hypothetical protein
MKPPYSPDEVARLGDSVYEHEVASRVTDEHAGCFVAIDVESGAFEIAPNELSAIDRLRERRPEAQIWLRRADAVYTHRNRRRLALIGERGTLPPITGDGAA